MNEGQKKFSGFILERTEDAKKEEAQALLAESFSRQADGTFDQEYLQAFIPRMLSCIRQDAVDEVKNIMMNFRHK